jgi:hypothetical protein
MFQMLGVFAAFERSMIRKRVMAGLSRAPKADGIQLGRRRLEDSDADKVAAIVAAHECSLLAGPAVHGFWRAGWDWGPIGLSAGWGQSFALVEIQSCASASVAKFPTKETGPCPVVIATAQRPPLIIFE